MGGGVRRDTWGWDQEWNVRNDTCWRWGEEGHVGGGVRRDMWEVG